MIFNDITQAPLFIILFICIWLYPLIPVFWHKMLGKTSQATWVFLKPVQRLVLPTSSSTNIRVILISSGTGALIFFLLVFSFRLFARLLFPEATLQSPSYYTSLGYGQVVLSILIQVIVAAFIASYTKHSRTFKALYTAFISAVLMVIAYNILGELFAKSPISFANLMTSILTITGFFVSGGALFALPIALVVSALAQQIRSVNQPGYQQARIERIPYTAPDTARTIVSSAGCDIFSTAVLVACVIVATLSGGSSALYAFTTSPSLPVPTVPQASSSTVNFPMTPYVPYCGKLLLNESLYTPANKWWDNDANCRFTADAYHVAISQPGVAKVCVDHQVILQDFLFEVTMIITTSRDSGLGGIVFRADTANNTYYIFSIARDGSYSLSHNDGNSGSVPMTLLEKCCTSVILGGEGQANVLAVAVVRNIITLYVNHQELGHVQDSKYAVGFTGTTAISINKPTDIAYNNMKIWALGNPPLYKLAT